MELMTFSLLASSADGAAKILSHPTWDLILIFVLVGGGLFWAFMAGRRKIVSTIMLTYVALALFSVVPTERLTAPLGLRDPYLGAVGIFVILFAVLVWLLGARRTRPFSPGGPWWQVLVLSFAQVGLLIHIALSFLPAERAGLLAPLTRRVFADPSVHLWWLLSPIILLVIIRRLAMREE